MNLDGVFALLPDYGAGLIAGMVFLSCLAIPLPSSMVVLLAGGLAAAGDFSLAQVAVGAFLGFIVGDQVAFQIGRRGGQPLLAKLKGRPARAALITKAESALRKRGSLAVILSRTLLSPLAPWVAYAAAASGLDWRHFTIPAVIGATIWTTFYAGGGYMFADNIALLAGLGTDLLIAVAALGALAGSGWWLLHALRRAPKAGKTPQSSPAPNTSRTKASSNARTKKNKS